jgi:hypothetical protein
MNIDSESDDELINAMNQMNNQNNNTDTAVNNRKRVPPP